MPHEGSMSDKPIGEIVGRQDKPASAPETGVASTSEGTASAQASGETSAAGGQAAPAEDPLAGLKGALEKERERASRFEKDFKKSERARQQEAAALRRELEALRAQAPKPDPKAIEDRFWSADGGPPEYVESRISSVKEELTKQSLLERVEEGRDLARERYEDFEDVEAAFVEAAEKDPSLWNSIQSMRPLSRANAVYKKGKQLLAGAENTPDKRIASLEAQIAELRAGRDGGQPSAAAETAAAPAEKPTVPRSNAGSRGSGVGKTTTFAGPTPIDQIFGRRRQAAR